MAAQDSRRLTVDELLARARARIHRRWPADAWACAAQIIDIRSADQRRADGAVPGALWFPRNVLEWRVDPASEHRDPAVAGVGDEILLLCDEGYQSTLAAAVMHDLGFSRAGDVIDGFQGWLAAGLPIEEVHLDDGRRRVGR
jgi:rhodanese-related sulfurtransferase